MALNSHGQELQRASLLHGTGSGYSQKAGGYYHAFLAAIAKADLAPLHGAAQRPFRNIVGRTHSGVDQKDEQTIAMPEHSSSQYPDLTVMAVHEVLTACQQFFLQRNAALLQLVAVDGAPTELMPQAKQPGMDGQGIAAEVIGVGGAGEFLDAQ